MVEEEVCDVAGEDILVYLNLDGFRLLARAISSTNDTDGSSAEDPFYVDIELDADLAIRSATGLVNEPVPEGALAASPGCGRLFSFGGDRWLLSDVLEATPRRPGRMAISRVAGDQFVDRRLLARSRLRRRRSRVDPRRPRR